MQNDKISAQVRCQIEACAEEASYHLDVVRFWKGRPICEDCYDNNFPPNGRNWNDLEQVEL